MVRRRRSIAWLLLAAAWSAGAEPAGWTAVPASEAPETLHVRSAVSEHRPWQRQQVVVALEVASPEAFFTLEAETPKRAGFDITALPVTARREIIEGVEHTVRRIGWAVFPYADGAHTLSLPAVRYVRGGRIRERLTPPPVHLQVQALPRYLPPTVPVGEVTVTAEPLGTVLRTGRLHWWTLTVSGRGVPAASLPPLLREVADSARLQVLPAETERSNGAAADGLHGRAVHRVPLKALSSGPLDLPTLRHQYFDPDSGRLVTRYLEPRRPWALGLLWPGVLAVLVAAALVALLRRAAARLRAAVGRRRRRRDALDRLAAAVDAPGMLQALRQLGAAEGWSANLTLAQWARHWRAAYRTGPRFEPSLAELESRLYGSGAQGDLQPLRDGLLAELRAARRRPSRLGRRAGFLTARR